MFNLTSEGDYLALARICYSNNAGCLEKDMLKDLRDFTSKIKYQLNKILRSGVYNKNKLINYIIIFHNLFGVGSRQLLIYKIETIEHRRLINAIYKFLGIYDGVDYDNKLYAELKRSTRN